MFDELKSMKWYIFNAVEFGFLIGAKLCALCLYICFRFSSCFLFRFHASEFDHITRHNFVDISPLEAIKFWPLGCPGNNCSMYACTVKRMFAVISKCSLTKSWNLWQVTLICAKSFGGKNSKIFSIILMGNWSNFTFDEFACKILLE